MTDLTTGQTWKLEPRMAYNVGPKDRHRLRAHTDIHLVSVFCPPLVGNEQHDQDGALARADLCRQPTGLLKSEERTNGTSIAGPGRHHRRRDRRLLGRLSPCQAGVEGRGAAGAQEADQRHDLACRRAWCASLYTANLTRLAKYTVDLYTNLEKETATGFVQPGSLSIATNKERWRSSSAARPCCAAST